MRTFRIAVDDIENGVGYSTSKGKINQTRRFQCKGNPVKLGKPSESSGASVKPSKIR